MRSVRHEPGCPGGAQPGETSRLLATFPSFGRMRRVWHQTHKMPGAPQSRWTVEHEETAGVTPGNGANAEVGVETDEPPLESSTRLLAAAGDAYSSESCHASSHSASAPLSIGSRVLQQVQQSPQLIWQSARYHRGALAPMVRRARNQVLCLSATNPPSHRSPAPFDVRHPPSRTAPIRLRLAGSRRSAGPGGRPRRRGPRSRTEAAR